MTVLSVLTEVAVESVELLDVLCVLAVDNVETDVEILVCEVAVDSVETDDEDVSVDNVESVETVEELELLSSALTDVVDGVELLLSDVMLVAELSVEALVLVVTSAVTSKYGSLPVPPLSEQ